MNKYSDLILKYQSGEMSITDRENFKKDFSLNAELRKEFNFQEILDKVMKESLFLEGFENDPNLIKAEILAQQDIREYNNKSEFNARIKVNNGFEIETEVEIRKRIAKAEVEMVLSGIDDISENWVRDFEKRKPQLHNNQDSKKILEFISNSDAFKEAVIHTVAPSRTFNRRVVFQVAAAVLVLSLLIFKVLTPSYSGDSVYNKFYEPLEASSFQQRGNSLEINPKLQEGVDLYLSGEYLKAEVAFADLYKSSITKPEVLLFTGLNQMGLKNFKGAVLTFNDLLSHGVKFVPEARWYLGLCYIKTGEISKAKDLLLTLSETKGIYKNKAQLILKTLNK